MVLLLRSLQQQALVNSPGNHPTRCRTQANQIAGQLMEGHSQDLQCCQVGQALWELSCKA